LPNIFADGVVDAMEDGEVEVFFGDEGEVGGCDDFAPLRDSKHVSFALLADEEKALEIHILDSFGLHVYLLAAVKQIVGLSKRFFKKLSDDDFEGTAGILAATLFVVFLG
jgi:hypothetical protein